MSGTPIVNSRDELETLEALYTSKPPMIRRLLEDVAPDIPQKKRSYLYIKLREKAQAEYEHASEDFEDWLRQAKEKLLGAGMAEEAVERALAAEAFTKVGYLRRLLGEAKVPAACDWVARAVRIGEPVVVFAEHQAPIHKLSALLRAQRIRHAIIEGKTSTEDRQSYIDQFQAHRFPVLLCSSAGREGITLHAARNLLFLERFFTSAAEEQAEDRIRRIGQRFPTTIWYLHAPGTIDDRLDFIVQAKRALIRTALRAEDTAETTQSNVETLIKSWNTFVCPERKTTRLGWGDPLPPLPRSGQTHLISFTGARWTKEAALSWCQMNGYPPWRGQQEAGGVRILIQPVEVFRPHEFAAFQVCKDIKVITGRRLSGENERLMRRKVQSLQNFQGP